MYKEFKTQLVTGLLSTPIIYIPHFHYELIDEVIKDIVNPGKGKLIDAGLNEVCEFDIQLGVIDFQTKKCDDDWSVTLEGYLEAIVSGRKNRVNNNRIFVIKNADKILDAENVQSLLRIYAQKYERGDYDPLYTIILVSSMPTAQLPSGLEKIFTAIDILPPNADEIRACLCKAVGPNAINNNQGVAEEMVRTLQGLQLYEVKQILKTILPLTGGRINKKTIRLALDEKKRIVKKSGIIEVIDTDVKFEDVGGLQILRDDLERQSAIYKNLGDAVKYNVPIPKGILIIGMPGCGKSMIAQATANKFGVSLLRLDVSRLMGKYVGESEANLRLALATAEAAHPCVLWIDEIEKAFAGGNSKTGDNDMLVMRMMGHFLTWMQERKTPVYIVATANDVMRPEFMRKGRFDEVYFVDFPTEEERAQILQVKINKKYPQTAKDKLFDFSELKNLKEVVTGMNGTYGGFSGSEIECVLNMVIEKKFENYLKQKNDSHNQEFVPGAIKITKKDFDDVINRIKDSVMSNQKSEKNGEKTSIERIKDMQKTYKFRNASIEEKKK